LGKNAEYVPDVLYVFPFQVYESQAIAELVEATLLLMVRFSTAVESHPCTEPLGKNAEYVPDVVYVFPFHVYELQAVAELVEATLLLMVRFSTAVESHPSTEPLGKNAEYVPDVV
jgi:hypothetical protein